MNSPETSRNDPSAALLRAKIMAVVAAAAFVVIALRLFAVQILRGDEFREKSLSNFVKLERVEHDRGEIVDREGRMLAANRPSVNVVVTPAFMPTARATLVELGRSVGLAKSAVLEIAAAVEKSASERGPPVLFARDLTEELVLALRAKQERLDLPSEAIPVLAISNGGADSLYAAYIDPTVFPTRAQVVRRLAALMDMTDEEAAALEGRAKSARGLDRYVDLLVRRDVSEAIVERLQLEIFLGKLPGVTTHRAKAREYVHEALGAHAIGYVNELLPDELEKRRDRGYRLGDVVGRRGVEESFEDVLRGVDGREAVVVDAKGRSQKGALASALAGELEVREPPRPGNRVVLAIDLDLQRAAERAFTGQAGAVVVMEVDTGRLLAITSTPSFNPSKVSGRLEIDEKRRLHAIAAMRPWRFRAIQDHFAPGSTFKVVTALAALETRSVGRGESIHCPGAFRLGDVRFRCWKDAGHGPVAFEAAIAKSCDVYFYTMGARMGLDAIAHTGEELGFGRKTGIAVAGEVPGIMPTRAWYERRARGSYTLGAAVNASIGQGAVAVTPLQLAVAYAAIANGGTVWEPQIALRVESWDGRDVREFPPKIVGHVDAKSEDLAAVREGLRQVVNEPWGTAYRRRIEGIEVAGKTGTAQVSKLGQKRLDEKEMPWEMRDNAWFAAFAPASKPAIVVVVMNEHGGHGASAAAPTAMQVIDAWHAKSSKREESPVTALDASAVR